MKLRPPLGATTRRNPWRVGGRDDIDDGPLAPLRYAHRRVQDTDNGKPLQAIESCEGAAHISGDEWSANRYNRDYPKVAAPVV